MLRLATVFSGIGAIEHALERMGTKHDTVFACDSDPFVKQSYFANHDIDESGWFNDICKLRGKAYRKKVDLFVGGSPCQSFSMVGKRKGLKDTRGTLFYEFARLIKEIEPKVFIFENVKGLLSHDEGKTWDIINSVFRQLGYQYNHCILNAKNYGIPQHRERLFVVGFRDDNPISEIKPPTIELKCTMQDFLEDNTDLRYFLPEKGIRFVTDPKNIMKRYTQINGDIALCQKANQQFNWHGDFVSAGNGSRLQKYYLSEKVHSYVMNSGTKNFYSRPETDLKIARPILSTMHKMHRAGVDNYITQNGKLRKLTPRECLRLMGFSDTFKIAVSDTQMYRQAGNSIVVDVLINLLRHIRIEKYAP